MKRAIIAISLLALSLGASGQLLDAPAEIRMIKTASFDIAYPVDCEASARYLATFADETYRLIAARLRVKADKRFPVVFTSGYDSFNGSFSAYPYSKIELYQSNIAPDDDLGSQSDDLRLLFTHELTHAVSLTMRAGLWNVLSFLFGDWIAPAGALVGTGNLSEGVTVTFESSLWGNELEGRANDPYIAALIRQALLERKEIDFWQSAGARDLYPFWQQKYYYGGWFSRYLQREYGDEAYARLWAVMSEGDFLAGVDGWPLWQGAFERVYGKALDILWNEFLDSMRIRTPIVASVRSLDVPLGDIPAITASEGRIFWADSISKRAYSFDERAGKVESLFDCDGFLNALDTSPDGVRLLVSSSRYGTGFDRYVTAEYDLEARRFTGREWPRVRDSCYYADGIAGVLPRGYESDIVAIAADGATRVIVPGDHLRSFASVDAAPDGSLWFLAHDETGFWIGRATEGPEGTVVERLISNALPWPRSVSIDSHGDAWISVCDRDGLPRVARVSGDRAYAQRGMVSGGARMPVATDGSPYAVAKLADGDLPYALDLINPALAFEEYPLEFARLSPSDIDRVSAYDAYEPGSDLPDGLGEEAPYLGALWAFRGFVVPAFRFTQASSLGLESAGLTYVSADPFETFSLKLDAYYNLFLSAPEAELAITAGPFRLEGWDDFLYDSRETSRRWYRSTGATLSVGESFALDTYWRQVGLSAYASASILAWETAGLDPWSWEYGSADTAFGAYAYYSDLRGSSAARRLNDGFTVAAFVDFDMSVAGALETPRPILTGYLNFALASLGLDASAWYQLSLDGRIGFTPGYAARTDALGLSAAPLRRPVFAEFADDPTTFPSYGFVDIAWTPFVLEAQTRILFLPLYLSYVSLTGGLRCCTRFIFLNSSYYARLEVGLAGLKGRLPEVPIKLWGELSVPFEGSNQGMALYQWGIVLPY
jgi:hypothetical protein